MLLRKTKSVASIKPGDLVEDLFVIKFKKPPEAYSNGWRFDLRLEDPSGGITLKYWGPQDPAGVKRFYESLPAEAVVWVRASAKLFQEKLELNANAPDAIRLLKPDEYLPEDFLPRSAKNPEEMQKQLLERISSVRDSDLRQVLEEVFRPEFLRRFTIAPGASHKHHAWLGGLIEHTLNVCALALEVSRLYPALNRDLLITGALLHDIGKVDEFETTTLIKVSEAGHLVGHISLGSARLAEIATRLATPPTLRNKLIHMMLSHHGKLEFGSPKQPAFPEAMVLALADELDAKAQMMTGLLATARTEDNFVFTRDFGNVFLK